MGRGRRGTGPGMGKFASGFSFILSQSLVLLSRIQVVD